MNRLSEKVDQVQRKIFLSYSREDDETFAKRLYDDLSDQGFEVWWDRTTLPNQRLTFAQEIFDAIENSDSLVFIVSPKSISSEHTTAELKHALQIGIMVIPILRKGDFDILPEELKRFQTTDFRRDKDYELRFKELVILLSESTPLLGPPMKSIPILMKPGTILCRIYWGPRRWPNLVLWKVSARQKWKTRAIT